MEAQTYQTGEVIDWVADGTYAAGDIVQVPDGRAGVVRADCVSGDTVAVEVTRGLIVTVPATTSMVMLMGSEMFWDYSANKAHLLHKNDRDFAIGCAVGGGPTHSGTIAKSSAGTKVNVALNVKPVYTAALEHGFATKPISTAGWPHGFGAGNGFTAVLDATAEAQKMDALGFRGVSVAGLAECIVDALICIVDNGNANVLDVNVGIANDTHASDADAITESLFAHYDGNDLNINLESDDGTTEVAATDTTVDFVEGTPHLVQWDLSNMSDIQVYVDGVNVLPNSVFKLNAAAGPLKPLVHVEKSANATPGNVWAAVGIRTAQNVA